MKFKYKIDAIGRLVVHCDKEINFALVNAIRKIEGVCMADITLHDRYSVTIKKGEMFDWDSIKRSIEVHLEKVQ